MKIRIIQKKVLSNFLLSSKYLFSILHITMTHFLTLLSLSLVSASYIPPYYEGTPTAANVVRIDPPDYRGHETFRLEFVLSQSDGGTQEGFVHRTWEEFQKLDHLLTTHLLNFGLSFPSEPTIVNLDSYLQRVLTHSAIVTSHPLNDFLGINWSGKDLTFLQDLPGFLYVVIPPLYRSELSQL